MDKITDLSSAKEMLLSLLLRTLQVFESRLNNNLIDNKYHTVCIMLYKGDMDVDVYI